MDIISGLIERIEKRLKETKKPCKSYATEAKAKIAAADVLAKGQNYFGTERPARCVVFFVPKLGRWCVGIDMTEYMRRPDFGGGYLGYFTGHYCY